MHFFARLYGLSANENRQFFRCRCQLKTNDVINELRIEASSIRSERKLDYFIFVRGISSASQMIDIENHTIVEQFFDSPRCLGEIILRMCCDFRFIIVKATERIINFMAARKPVCRLGKYLFITLHQKFSL